ESVRRAAVVLITSNRGLAGAFNVNLIREARRNIKRLRDAGVDVEIHVVGKKASSFLRYQKEDLATARTDITDKPTLEDAMSIIEPLREDFEAGRLDEVYVVHAQFRSALSTPPTTMKVLPVSTGDGGDDNADSAGRTQSYILSPSGDESLNRLRPRSVRASGERGPVR